MRHKQSGRKLGRRADHRKAMIKNLTESLVLNGRIETTVTRAKEVRSYAEKLITKAKKGDLHSRRIVISRLHTKEAAAKIFDELASKYENRDGGYTRILKTRNRVGDASPMAIIELVEEELPKKKKKKKPAKKAAPKAEIQEEEAQVAEEPAADTSAEEPVAEAPSEPEAEAAAPSEESAEASNEEAPAEEASDETANESAEDGSDDSEEEEKSE